jgi:hypothetical protein
MAKPTSLVEAIFQVQHAGGKLVKDASFNYGNYATLGAVLEVLKPLFADTGIVVIQSPDMDGPTPVLRTIVTHVDHEGSFSFASPMILEKETMQKVGSAVTYAKRYALVSIFLMDADEDDDGNAASGDEAAAKVVAKRAARKPKVAEDATEKSEEAKRVF